MLPKEPYKRFGFITLYIAVGVALVYLIFNYLWGAILPFVLAYLFAECFRPVVRYSERNQRFPKRFFVLFVVLLAAVSVAMLIYALSRQVVMELRDLSASAKEAITRIRVDEQYAEEMIEKINSMIPFVDLRERLWEMRGNLDEELWSIILSFGEKMSGSLISVIGGAAAFLPNALLFTAVLILATYYFAVDRVRINCFFLSLFPKNIRPLLKTGKDILANTAGKYFRAYGTLFVITFFELLAAFLIIGIDYSFILALLIALIDVLPVLGTGTVLVPWSAVLLISGNYGKGIGLLVTYAVITVIRQIIEPKIVGKFIGLSPLAALASMYIGLKLMGIIGIFLFPIAAIILKRIIEVRQEVLKENSEDKGM